MIFSPRTREAIIAQLPEREFALLIVGGGSWSDSTGSTPSASEPSWNPTE